MITHRQIHIQEIVMVHTNNKYIDPDEKIIPPDPTKANYTYYCATRDCYNSSHSIVLRSNGEEKRCKYCKKIMVLL